MIGGTMARGQSQVAGGKRGPYQVAFGRSRGSATTSPVNYPHGTDPAL